MNLLRATAVIRVSTVPKYPKLALFYSFLVINNEKCDYLVRLPFEGSLYCRLIYLAAATIQGRLLIQSLRYILHILFPSYLKQGTNHDM